MWINAVTTERKRKLLRDYIVSHDGVATAREAAAHFGWDKANTSTALKKMWQDGLLSREAHGHAPVVFVYRLVEPELPISIVPAINASSRGSETV
jgi:DNA-binding MarR family transcriptional regulator